MIKVNSMAQDNGGYSWTRYSNYILSGYNTTGVSLKINGQAGQGATLISNRHVLLARHVSNLFTYPQTIYFVNNANTTFSYTINSAANVATIGPPPGGPGYTDISIGYLNTTVDSSLSFHKVIPENFLNYVQYGKLDSGNQYLAPYLPVFYMDGGDGLTTNKRTWCGNLKYVTSQKLLFYSHPRSGPRYNNSQALTGGDSGNIIFIPVNGEIVILGTWYLSSVDYGQPGDPIGISSFISPNINAINSAMTSLAGTSYSVTQADLSTFRIF